MTTQKRRFILCDQVRETAFALPRSLRHEHLEEVCENGSAHRLRKAELCVEQQHGLSINLGTPKLEIQKYACSQPN